MADVSITAAGLASCITAAIAWYARTLLGARRIDKVDSVTARAEADATVVEAIRASYEGMLETQRQLYVEQGKRLDEQSKRLDMLERQLREKDDAIRERDAVIRRLRDHLDVYYHALLERGVSNVAPPPEVPVAPERRSPDTAALAEPIVEAARKAPPA